MLAIRLFRVGKKNQPAFKIVVTDKKNASTRGRFVEEVGFYNPLTKQRNLKGDRVKYWMSVGAKPSETVHNMLVSDKIIEGAKIPKNKKSKKEPSQETPTTDVSAVASTEAKEEPAASVEDSSAEAPAKEKVPAVEKETPEEPVEEKPKETEAETPAPVGDSTESEEEKKKASTAEVQETPAEEKGNKPEEEQK